MPTTAVQTYAADRLQPAYRPEEAVTLAVRFAASLNVPKGAVVAQITATPGLYTLYDDALATGAEVAKGLAMYAFQTDANGRVTYSSTASTVGDERNRQHETAPIYVEGYFKTADINQVAGAGALDAAAIADLGRLVSGVLADGVLHMR